MSDEAQLDLRALAEVDEPEVVREALRRFRRRLWTRYLWIGLAIVLGSIALVVGSRPSDLSERIDGADRRGSSWPAVIRVDDVSIALAEWADLGDSMGIHFIALVDPSESSPGPPGIWVRGERSSMSSSDFDTYVEVPKNRTGLLQASVGPIDCPQPSCPGATTFTIDLRALGIPPSFWRAEG